MKKLIILLGILIFSACCDKEECMSEIQDNFVDRTFHNIYFCDQGQTFERVYFSEEDYKNDMTCQIWEPIPIDIEFKGIIAAIGIEVPYGGKNAYTKSVKLEEDICDKILRINFILETKDTSNLFYNNESVLIFLKGYDESYEVKMSHEIIPFKG